MTRTLRLGTRGSLLARTQSQWIADALGRAHGVVVEVQLFQTRGDQILDRPLPEIGGKGLFTEVLDQALLEERIDLAVHSLKDLPTQAVPGTTVACIPEREDPRDALVGPEGRPCALEGLPSGATVGTSSMRRQALLGAFRPDVRAESVRGNLDTRLRKLDEGRCDALLLAAAGLRRLGLGPRIGELLDRTSWLPAPGQGALGVVTRAGDGRLARLLEALHHTPTASAVTAERAMLARLEGGCQVPIGALGIPFDGGVRLFGMVLSPDGRRVVRADLTGRAEPERLGAAVAELLLSRGAGELLDDASVASAPSPTPP